MNKKEDKNKNEPKPEEKGFQAPGSLQVLQTMFYFDILYVNLLCVFTLLINIYKLNSMPYPRGYFSIEIIMLVFYFLLSQLRIEFGKIGNRIESRKHILLMLFFTIFSVICNMYFMLAQTYIFKVEFFLQWIAVVFAAIELLIGILATIAFKNLNSE